MWTVLKFKPKKIEILKKNLTTKLGDKIFFYYPRAIFHKYINNKMHSKDINLLGDYLLCFHKKFNKNETIKNCRYIKGLEYFLNNHPMYQKDITSFINKCKNCEDRNGYVSHNLFDLKLNSKYQFFSGPFTNMIFKITEMQKNKIKILMGNVETLVKKEEHQFRPI